MRPIPPARPAETSSGGRVTKSFMKRVLVIEDEPLFREVLAETLSGDGWEVSFASDGAEGLALALAVPPDAIVLDLVLPWMNGFDVLEALRRAPETKSIPIVVTTAKSYPADRKKALDLGANEFFLKPYDTDILRAVIKRLLRLPMTAKI